MKDRVLQFLRAAKDSGGEITLPPSAVLCLLRCVEMAINEEGAAEREACAKIAEGHFTPFALYSREIAAKIRARGNPAPVESDESYQASEALLNARRGE